MSEKEPPNPFEEIQRQLKEIFKDSKISVSTQNISNDTTSEVDNSGDISDSSTEENKNEQTLEKIQNFNLKPKEIRDYLDRFVMRQSEAKKVLSVAICDHYNHVRKSVLDERRLPRSTVNKIYYYLDLLE